jgi:hypothetical protein
MKKFNVTNPSQHPSVMSKKNKTSFRKKQYTMPSGIIREVMGYEPFALHLCTFKTPILRQVIF